VAAKKIGSRLGSYVRSSTAGEHFDAYIPPPLPPDPPLELNPRHQDLMERANRALGRLDGVATLLPETPIFLYAYVRKEALLSSQIEGTQSTLSDLLLYESKEVPGVPIDDVEEVSTYVAAINHGLKRLRGGFPLSLRLIREIHKVLLSTGRGSNKAPGEFRTSQNWIGGTRPGNARYVPPPPDRVPACMGSLEKFLHDDPVKTPLLIKAALSHAQFETIHPFLDGNGRLGRLLITLLLCAEEALSQPMLYLSLYFKAHRERYYELLQRVRTQGDWEAWVEFFLEGVLVTSEQATRAAKRIMDLFKADRARIEALGRPTVSALRVHQLLCEKIIIAIPSTTRALRVTKPTVAAAMRHLQSLGIVRELTGRKRNKLYVYQHYLRILDEGTTPLR
jgi:Fic family protein